MHDSLSSEPLGTPAPNFITNAAGLINPTDSQLGVKSAGKKIALVDEYVGLIHQWQDLFKEMNVYVEWSRRLVAPVNAGDDPADRERLAKVFARLAEIRSELFGIGDTGELQRADTVGDLRHVYQSLSRLAQYGVERPGWNSTPTNVSGWPIQYRELEVLIPPEAARFLVARSDSPTGSTFEEWLPEGQDIDVGATTGVVVHSGRRFSGFLTEAIVFLGAFITSFATIRALYGDTFGTFDDYLKVFVGSFALTFVADTVFDVWQRRRDPFTAVA
jgi:hypothetical protein